MTGVSNPHHPPGKDHRQGASVGTPDSSESGERPDRPSLLQMTASALTAVSATALLSFLGLWGTVFGMGLLSVLTVLGNYMYSTSIQRTADKVKQARPMIQGARGPQRAKVAENSSLAPGWHAAESPKSSDAGESWSDRLRTLWRSTVARYGTRRIVLSFVAVFVVLAGTITVIEWAAGKPMTDIVRNNSGGGTTVFGNTTSRGSGSDQPSDSDGESGGQGQSDEPQDGQETPDDSQEEGTPDESQQDGEDSSPEDAPTEEAPVESPPADDGSTQ